MADTPPTPPTPPAALPAGLIESLEDRSPTELRRIAVYAEALAVYRERRRRAHATDDDRVTGEQDGEGDDGPGDDRDRRGDLPDDRLEEVPDDRPDEVPDDVPSKASLTVKEINDNRYYYWQWREGESIRSKYERPVDPNE